MEDKIQELVTQGLGDNNDQLKRLRKEKEDLTDKEKDLRKKEDHLRKEKEA